MTPPRKKVRYNPRDPGQRFWMDRGRAYVDREGNFIENPSPPSPMNKQERFRYIMNEMAEAHRIFRHSPSTPRMSPSGFAKKNNA